MSAQFDFALQANPPIERLRIEGRQFLDPLGDPMRFWGVNVVAFYPDRATATAFARNLASMGVNLVRLHHLMRSSLDWNTHSGIPSLSSYADDTSRAQPGGRDAAAWERLDFLVAELHRNGIYVMLSADFSRQYRAGDVSILATSPADEAAWSGAVTDMTAWSNADWSATMDKWKMLPVIDERCALVQEELLGQLLERTNPYLGVTYARNPQIVGMEILNEFSSFYTIVMGNRFENTTYSRISYFRDALLAKWNAHLAQNGVSTTFDLYAPSNEEQHLRRQLFLNELDLTHRTRIVATAASHGCEFPVTFSNLWRSESDMQLRSRTDPYSENHIYGPPDVTKRTPYYQIWNQGGPEAQAEDFLYAATVHAALDDKPYIIGELNIDANQGSEDIERRAQQLLAAAAYGSHQGWSGIVWFAWNHGDALVGGDGWSPGESTNLSVSDLGGSFIADSVRLDHFRAAATMFRNGLVSESVDPLTVHVEDPVWNSYGWPPAAKELIKPGWHNRNAIRRHYGPKPAGQDTSPMMTMVLSDPIVSDTRQISKNMGRRQLTVATPHAEGFSGVLDGNAPDLLTILKIDRISGFATVLVAATDGADLAQSKRIVVSRNAVAGGVFDRGPDLRLAGLRAPEGNQGWFFRAIRPRANEWARWWRAAVRDAQGALVLPTADDWNEAELFWGVNPGETAVVSPIGLAVLARGTDHVELVWRDPQVCEVGYLIERSSDGGASWTFLAHLPANTQSYLDDGLTANTDYRYRVRAGNWGGISDPGDVLVVRTDADPTRPSIPTAPGTPSVTNLGQTTLTLTWTDQSNNENGFLIDRALGNGDFAPRALVDVGTTDLYDWGLTPNTTYRYRLRASNAGGFSAYTSIVSATTQA